MGYLSFPFEELESDFDWYLESFDKMINKQTKFVARWQKISKKGHFTHLHVHTGTI